MGKGRTVSTAFWNDKRIRRLKNSEKLLALYLLTAPQSNSLGIWQVRFDEAAGHLGWQFEDVRKILAALVHAAGPMIHYDPAANVILFPNWLRHHRRLPPNTIKGWAVVISELPPTPLIDTWLAVAEVAINRLGAAHVRAFEKVKLSIGEGSKQGKLFVGSEGSEEHNGYVRDRNREGNHNQAPAPAPELDARTSDLDPSKQSDLVTTNKEDCFFKALSPNPQNGGPPAGQQLLADGPLQGRVRFTGRWPLWYDWATYQFIWASDEAMAERFVIWRRRYPGLNVNDTMSKAEEWMETHRARGRRKLNLVKWLGSVWLAIDAEKPASTAQQVDDDDDWDGIAEA